jgi:hypothetical protein
MRTRYGAGVSIPTTDGAEIEALAGSNSSFAAWEQNEPYTIALLIKGRSGGTGTKRLYRSGTSSTGDHILFLSSGTTPNLAEHGRCDRAGQDAGRCLSGWATWKGPSRERRPQRGPTLVPGAHHACGASVM